MAVEVGLSHKTHYTYDRRVNLGPQTIRLRPAPHTRGGVRNYSLKIEPSGHFLNWQQDPFGNFLARAVFPEPTDHLKIDVGLVAEIRSFNPFDFFLDEDYSEFPFSYAEGISTQLKPYLTVTESGPLFSSFVESIDRTETRTVDFLVRVNQMLYAKLGYLIRLEAGVQTGEDTLSKGSGSCRDFAWLLCQTLRQIGLATRFVSGYLIQLKPDVRAIDGPSGPEEDFTDLHAWTEVYLPGAGWVGLDATSGLLAGEGHIPLCCTPFPYDAAPVTGELEECESKMSHTMSITRLNEDRRITKPFTEEEWQKIVAQGRHVDKQLVEHDVRLTMGGEPTFVPTDNIESESWVGEALGDGKWQRGLKLLLGMRRNLPTGSLVHLGQGKWYPGEQLPRWAISAHYRLDGEPILAGDDCLPVSELVSKASVDDAKKWISTLCQVLGMPDDYFLPAREASGETRGYVLPLLYSQAAKRWISSSWGCEHVQLEPGDSAMGYRLPLQSIPPCPAGDQEVWPHRDPFATVASFESLSNITKRIKGISVSPLPEVSKEVGYVRTALCAEVRDDSIYIFLPPVSYAEHFLDLVAAIELAAKHVAVKIRFEGYRPPYDRRLQTYSVTPDPGVLEVNVAPVRTWDQYLTSVQDLYETAHTVKLSSSRFFLDGRRVGTGGGNHIVLGAERPEDSPFLRRPDLLQSMLSFWQNHPSLSYLFSSEFIGPTSQAPRIDEARNDSLYELELAFNRITEDSEVPPWLVDRLFRNLLIDSSGNTHRTEFSIDKLFCPTNPVGRLGLLEMRGFEMPPHPRMALVQGLLVRACIALFWKKPYQERLVRWGTQLHDQFLLPEYIWSDFQDVLEFLRREEFSFSSKWFEAFLDFRCPVWGQTQVRHMGVELRHALEPWNVMGEDLYQGHISRAVDSSVERLQVKVTGFDDRYDFCCNGFKVPLRKSSDSSSHVAGVRYKAWQPPSGLHPTLPVNTPLIFDLVEKASGHSVGGCTFYSCHPGGRSFETVPINENEAESRCRARFSSLGHTMGKVAVNNLDHTPEFPNTLDLRKAPLGSHTSKRGK